LAESQNSLDTVSPEEVTRSRAPCKEGIIRKPDLVNRLNFLNFTDRAVTVRFRHRRFDTTFSLRAKPEPCSGDTVRCVWEKAGDGEFRTGGYTCLEFFFPDDSDIIVVDARIEEMNAGWVRFRLPDTARRTTLRQTRRVDAFGVSVRLLQMGACFSGVMEDFSPRAFRARLSMDRIQTFRWIDPEQPVTIILESGGTQIFSGECMIIRHEKRGDSYLVVVSPRETSIRRFRPRQHRSLRHTLYPSPCVRFTHPVTGGMLFLKTRDISGSGFSVEERRGTSLLLPGMMLSKVCIELAGCRIAECTVQVLYTRDLVAEHGEKLVLSGCVILDMNTGDQMRLSSLLHQAVNDRIFLCGNVDPERLWRFFFECGFIYPSKYSSLEPMKEDFRRTYEKLYLNSPSIARHFLFQEHGALYAHLSMIRFYPNSWLIQHHAAGGSAHPLAGIEVLDHVAFYVNEVCPMASAHMNYVMCYFRPENRFPSKVFGGVVRDLNSPKEASLDQLGYCRFRISPPVDKAAEGPREPESPEDRGCRLEPAGAIDLMELESAYERMSGGLMLEALNIGPDPEPDRELDSEYLALGFHRSREILAVRRGGALKAVVMTTRSDVGLNLSNLTNCVHIFIIDREDFPPDVVESVLTEAGRGYDGGEVPVLVFPRDAADSLSFKVEKTYTLWVIETHNEKGYFSSLRNTFKRPKYE